MGAYETHPGSGMIASSPVSRRAMHVIKRVCFVGATSTFSAFAGMRFSFCTFSATACRSSRIPGAGVYFVKSASRAFFAASTMWAGVGKSGSPIARERTFSQRGPCVHHLLDPLVARELSLRLHVREALRPEPGVGRNLCLRAGRPRPGCERGDRVALPCLGRLGGPRGNRGGRLVPQVRLPAV